MRIAILGAGAWGSALAVSLCAQHSVALWSRRREDCAALAATRRSLKKTPAQYLTENLVVTCSGNFSAAAFLCTVKRSA